jgi:galactokinase
MKILIESLVPPAAGVSSSSAFTVCSALATAHANGLKIQKEILADITV